MFIRIYDSTYRSCIKMISWHYPEVMLTFCALMKYFEHIIPVFYRYIHDSHCNAGNIRITDLLWF